MMTPPAIRVRAHAKINISLRVAGRRADGYHELRTVFQSIALHDTMIVSAHRGPFRLTATDPTIPTGRSNLVCRAAEAVWRAAKRRGDPHGVHIHLVKRIPAGGGLAGGSTDAAAALRALNTWWRAGLDDAAAAAIARSLGADVPYFLHGGTALGLDRGDLIVPLPDLSPRWIALVTPPFAVSTAAAFDWFDLAPRSSPRATDRLPGAAGSAIEVANDLEPVVAARHPEIRRITRALSASGAAAAAMTGSGSTVFGVFSTETAAKRAVTRVAGEGRALVSRFLGRRAFVRSSRPAAARNLPRTARIG